MGEEAKKDDKKGASASSPMLFHSKQTVLLIIAALAALFLPDDEHKYWSGGGSLAHHMQINAILIILTALVTISLTFEYLHHHLHHATTDLFMPVLKALNGELMGLGFLAIIFYLIEVRFDTLTDWSIKTVCVECDPCQGFPTTYHASGDDEPDDDPDRRLSFEDEMMRRLGVRRLAAKPDPPGTGCNFDACWASYNYTALSMTNTTAAHFYTPVDHTHYAIKDSERETECDKYHPVKEATRFLQNYELENPGFIESNGGLPLQANMQDYYGMIMKLPVQARHEAIHGIDNFAEHRKLGGAMTGECWHCDQILLHLFEDVHMTLFLVMVLYFIRSVLLIQQTEWQSNKWRLYESRLKTSENGEQKALESYYSTMKNGGMFEKMKAREFMEYVLLRKRFLKTGVQSGALEESNFNFAEYLSIVLGHSAAHMVHIPPKAWAILELVFILFWACMQAPTETRIRGFMLIALVVVATMFIFFGKMYKIRDQLLLKIPSSPYQCPANFMDELEKTAANPSYLQNRMKTSPGGKIVNQQEVCFWWGSNGPVFIMHVVRLLNMNMLIYFVLLGFATPYTAKNDEEFLGPLLAFIPCMVLANYFGPAEMMRVYSIISSVELLKDTHAIEHTIRIVKLARSIRTIKLLRSLQSVVENKKMLDEAKASGTEQTTTEEFMINWDTLTDEERARADQLQEVFGMFDSSGDGCGHWRARWPHVRTRRRADPGRQSAAHEAVRPQW